jgi:DNA-binding transcriptional LysR family regulator
LRQSDLLATVPERFAQRVLRPYELVQRDLPIKVDDSAIHQFWHGRLHRDPGHQWLRHFIGRRFSEGRAVHAERPM